MIKPKILKSATFRASFIFWISTMLANVVNWLYNVVAGRTLSREDFAVLTVFLTMYTLVVVPANALATTVSRYIALYTGKKDEENHHSFFRHYAGLSLTFGLLGLSIFVVLASPLQTYFSLESLTYLLLFAPSLLFLFLVAFQRGVLKGNLAFGSVGLLLVTEAITKLVALIIAPRIGWPLLTTAIISLPVSVLFSWLVSIGLTRIHHPTRFKFLSRPMSTFAETYTFFGNSFSASVGTALLNSVSILMVKHYFSAAEAGVYAILVLFGKILFFGAGGIIEISLPLIVRERAQGQSGRRQFLILVSLVSLVAGAIYSVYFIFPVQVISFFIGEKGLVTLPYLRVYTFGIFALIIMSCVSAYNVAKKNFAPARLILVTAIIQGILIALFHDTLWQVVMISTLTLSGLTVITVLMEGVQLYKHQSQVKNEASLLNLILNYVPFSKRNTSTLTPKLPAKLEGLTLKKALVVPGLNKPHAIGLYQNKTGEQFVAKIWRGTAHNPDAASLINELKTYQLLNQVVNRSGLKLSKAVQKVHIPQLVYSKITDTQVVIITEFVNGELLRNLPTKTKKSTFTTIFSYLDLINQQLLEEEKSHLPTRSGTAYLILFPAIWMVAVIRQPRLIGQFIKAAWYFGQAIPDLLSQKATSLVHRDLHTHNVLVSKDKISIIDWQRAVVTFPAYEFATTLPIEFNDSELFQHLVELLWKKNNSVSKIFIRALLLNYAVHGLTANNLPELNITRYKKMLTFALSL